MLGDKKKAYADFRQARKEMQELLIARKNIETILEMETKQEEQKKKEEQSL